MSVPAFVFSRAEWARLGLTNTGSIHYQSPPEELVQDALRRGEGRLSEHGALVIDTGTFTGRSPLDRFLVNDAITAPAVDWNDFNIAIAEAQFLKIQKATQAYFDALPEIWVRDCAACADPEYRLNIRVLCEKPSTALFAYNMFLRLAKSELENFKADWQVYVAPGLQLDPDVFGTRRQNASIISFTHKTIIVAGTGYTGEVKKGVFTVLNFLLPAQNVLSMHCSANRGPAGDTAIFFGLSGTGKTTLSADPERQLIGDDEHGWSGNGVFNIEGGCYAKLFGLTQEAEPQIYQAIRAGALVENTPFLPGTNCLAFNDRSITENTRVSYPLHFIDNALQPAAGAPPKNIFFLTCDSFGVLPPLAKLSVPQAMYQFVSGYTAKIAGTEEGVREPRPTFSACFGAPFMPLHPGRYATMLGEKIKESGAQVWLINTGWTGGPYGTGSRMQLAHTRAMIQAVFSGALQHVAFERDPVFGFAIPLHVPGVPAQVLHPRQTWGNGPAYDKQAHFLASLFIKNFEKYASGASAETLAAAPAF